MGFRYATGRLYKKAVSVDPTSISGLKLWLDFSDASTLYTDAGSTLVSSDGDAIYQANDKSGDENHVQQAVLDLRPEYKTNIKNGLNSIYFDGSNANEKLLNINPFNHSLPATLFMLITITGTWTSSIHVDFGHNNYSLRQNNNIYNGAYLYAREDSAPCFSGNLVCVYLNTVTQFYINGTPQNSGNAGTRSANGIAIGNRYNETGGTVGYYHEIILYDGNLSDTDRQSVESYLNNKWAIY